MTPAQLGPDFSGEAIADAYYRAERQWPWLHAIDGLYELPDGLSFAMGYVETRLTNEVGDYGHGHGVWQLDDRSHVIPAGFDQDVPAQAHIFGTMMSGTRSIGKALFKIRVCAYNAGAQAVATAVAGGLDPDSVTTQHDYFAKTMRALVVIHGLHIAEHLASARQRTIEGPK